MNLRDRRSAVKGRPILIVVHMAARHLLWVIEPTERALANAIHLLQYELRAGIDPIDRKRPVYCHLNYLPKRRLTGGQAHNSTTNRPSLPPKESATPSRISRCILKQISTLSSAAIAQAQ